MSTRTGMTLPGDIITGPDGTLVRVVSADLRTLGKIEDPTAPDVARWPVEGEIRCVVVKTRPLERHELAALNKAKEVRKC